MTNDIQAWWIGTHHIDAEVVDKFPFVLTDDRFDGMVVVKDNDNWTILDKDTFDEYYEWL